MTILLVVAAGVILVQAVVLAMNLAYWKRPRAGGNGKSLRVSVLIPARNERDNLPGLLAALAAQDFAPWEILVCDDASDDGTGDWLRDHARPAGAEWFRAPDKPEDWVGKCWACHQLGMRASGDWLLFLDADVTPGSEFLGQMACLMASTEAFLVTALPRFATTTPGDGMLTAMVPFSVFSLLPLPRAEKDPREAFAFANGQVMGFRSADYHRSRPHEQVREMLLEDVGLARWAKRLGCEVLVVDATRTLTVRMYHGLGPALRGLGRMAVPICGGIPQAMLTILVMAIAYLVPWVGALTGDLFALTLGALGALLFGICAWRFGLGAWYALLTPVAVALTIATMVQSILWHRRGGVPWKGRVYDGMGSSWRQELGVRSVKDEQENCLDQDGEPSPPHGSAGPGQHEDPGGDIQDVEPRVNQ
jgi:chlorobactene glucosyltransferase